MGTRNLTIVIHDQKVRVAEFRQWDGYPEEAGITLLKFLNDASKVDQLRRVLSKVRFLNEEDSKNTSLKSGGSKKTEGQYPLSHYHVGGEILECLLKFKNSREIILDDAYSFAGNSFWCEWAYVVDLDKETFEIYRGKNQSRLTSADRFFSLSEPGSEYYPVRIVQSFPLNNLPSESEFIFLCKQVL